jgi:hypothetical protein
MSLSLAAPLLCFPLLCFGAASACSRYNLSFLLSLNILGVVDECNPLVA